MQAKMVDKTIKSFIKSCSTLGQRMLFVLVGKNGAFQIQTLYEVLSKGKTLSVLWCSKEKTDENSERNSLIPQKELQFKPNFCCYSDIHKIQGHFFSMIVITDFEALTPNIIASVVGTVRRGGMIVFLMNELKELQELEHFQMDFHRKLDIKTEQNSAFRFNKRFVHFLNICSTCVVLKDDLTVLKMPSKSEIYSLNLGDENELTEIKEKHKADKTTEMLLNECQTVDQCNLLLKFLDVLKKRTYHASVVATSPHGCGKSAALGLAIAGSLALNYSNIFISSLKYENVKIVFKFLFKGLDVLGYEENKDYDVIEAVNPEFKNSLIGLNIFKDHPQAVRFVRPVDVKDKLEQAELVIIDEASAIPQHLLKLFVGPHVVLMSSTTSGYSAVGQNLYSNIVNTFGISATKETTMQDTTVATMSDVFHKVTLNEPIYYSANDCVENWLNQFLCLKPSIGSNLSFGCPHPEQCVLYSINRDSLFSCSPTAELFLHSLTSFFASSKKQNTADYFVQMADAPNHHLFCLLPPSTNAKRSSPEILCAILVHMEHQIPSNIVYCAANQQQYLPNCLSEWTFDTVSEENMLSIPGVHILDLVTHPQFQRMGYGMKSLQLLQEFYEGKFISLDESSLNVSSTTDQESGVLLNALSDIQPDKACYFLASYGLSSNLLRFWKKAGFICSYLTKEVDSSAEHLFYMLKNIGSKTSHFNDILQENWTSFREYFFLLLSAECKHFGPAVALSLLTASNTFENSFKGLTREDIDIYIKPRFMRSLEKYNENQKDIHCIMPIIPIMSKLYFRGSLKNLTLSYVQEAILLSLGLQRKTVNEISKDLTLPSSQIYALLNRTIKKIRKHLVDIIERSVEKSIIIPSTIIMQPLAEDLDQELEVAGMKIKMEIENTKNIKNLGLSTYAIKGSEEEWKSALQKGRKTLVSIKSLKKSEATDNLRYKSKHSKSISKSKHKHGKSKKRK